MKQIAKSIATMITLSIVGYAGGNIVPVEPVVPETAEPVVSESAFYVGLGFSYMSLRDDLSDEEFSATGVMLQAGYQFNKYFAIEGRYTRDISDVEYDHGDTINPDYDDYPTDFSNIAIYLKPMYPLENFNVYALLGYGRTELTNIPLGGPGISADRAESGFQWGLGAAYNATEQISVFVDYVRFYDDTGFDYRAQRADVNSDAWTLGVSYKF
ncbi:porin family protein [Sulfurovum sp.]|uniref:porin family protein n=1 Tax=Sulfurovum sp. TaxID=1969726 RepID=UPI0025D5E64A|nr:porin family protein [Sulfurovum sp.]